MKCFAEKATSARSCPPKMIDALQRRKLMKETAACALLLLGLAGTARADGCHVESVAADSPAEKAGIKTGDTITAVNGKTIRSHSDLLDAVRSTSKDLRMFLRR